MRTSAPPSPLIAPSQIMPNNPSSTLEPSSLAAHQDSTQPLDNPPGDTQLVADVPKGPASKRRVKRALEKRVAGKAVELDNRMQALIDEGAEDLGVSPSILAQKFAIVAPMGETRKPMWWNGLVAERSEEWKAEYGAYNPSFRQVIQANYLYRWAREGPSSVGCTSHSRGEPKRKP
jgi:hypothetical protein